MGATNRDDDDDDNGSSDVGCGGRGVIGSGGEMEGTNSRTVYARYKWMNGRHGSRKRYSWWGVNTANTAA